MRPLVMFLLLLCCWVGGCAAAPRSSTGAASPTAARAEVAADPSPVGLPEPTARSTDREKRARLEVEPARASLKRGGTVVFTIRNVGDGEFVARRPHGASGCATLAWKAVVSTSMEVIFWDRTEQAPCPRTPDPSEKIISPGEVAGTVSVDTSAHFEMDASHARPGAPTISHRAGAPLPSGHYRVEVTAGGAWGPLEASLEVTK